MKITLKILFIFVAFLFAGASNAQKNGSYEEMLKQRVARKVAQMNDYIEFIANPQRSKAERLDFRKRALNLFVGRGNSYTENGEVKNGVVMQITSIYRKNPTKRLMRDYFTGLINMRYSNVKIESTDFTDMKVSELKKVSEGEYVCTCVFSQAFCGFDAEGKPKYKDITKKRVTCHVLVQETTAVSKSGTLETNIEYIVLLGDVEALETKRIM